MWHWWVSLCVAAAPPSADKAEAFAKQKQWEELYLAFAAASPKALLPADTQRIGAALTKGCEALAASDAVMAFSLGDKAVEFSATADALLCTGTAGLKADQKSAAEDALTKGRKSFPKDARFPLALGELALSEDDADGAIAALLTVPKGSPQSKQADALLKRARAVKSGQQGARAEAAQQERDLLKQQEKVAQGKTVELSEAPLPPPGKQGGPPPRTSDSLSYESGVDGEGRRIRSNQHFRFRYFNGQKDFGQRAEYEGRVQGALDVARTEAKRILGVARESPTDVILYSREEFRMHHGPQFAQAVAGFYSDSAIRMNDTAEINARNQATLVHEYVHAVIDEVSGFHSSNVPIWLNEGLAEWTEWRHQGHDSGPPGARIAMRGEAQKRQLPQLSAMARGALVNSSDPALAYAVSASAVGLLMKDGGADNLLGMLKELGAGAAFGPTLQKRYGRDLDRLQEQLQAELEGR